MEMLTSILCTPLYYSRVGGQKLLGTLRLCSTTYPWMYAKLNRRGPLGSSRSCRKNVSSDQGQSFYFQLSPALQRSRRGRVRL